MTTIKQYKAMIDGASDGLLPCPFCGCTEISHWYDGSSNWTFECQNCDKSLHMWVRIPLEDWDNGKGGENGEAVRRWNARADKLTPELIRVMELMGEALLNAQATLRHYRLYDLEKVEQAISEYRKLRGE